MLSPRVFAIAGLLAGAGCTQSLCEDAEDHVVDGCGVGETSSDESECDAYRECLAQCVLDAPCFLFDESYDPEDEVQSDAMADYVVCELACSS